ncbi:hypothetical protein EGW08_021457 [Elysia chlorotica]|uniref:Uncharacterized protein n=1 Tax=Elysia chlorotica TaxID=188477 RepID=A0A3S0ZMD8_ELYCH|nr:hypothetical protein EGW08_021457 [Elysia chlorotica]
MRTVVQDSMSISGTHTHLASVPGAMLSPSTAPVWAQLDGEGGGGCVEHRADRMSVPGDRTSAVQSEEGLGKAIVKEDCLCLSNDIAKEEGLDIGQAVSTENCLDISGDTRDNIAKEDCLLEQLASDLTRSVSCMCRVSDQDLHSSSDTFGLCGDGQCEHTGQCCAPPGETTNGLGDLVCAVM